MQRFFGLTVVIFFLTFFILTSHGLPIHHNNDTHCNKRSSNGILLTASGFYRTLAETVPEVMEKVGGAVKGLTTGVVNSIALSKNKKYHFEDCVATIADATIA
ncbi:hypothetical protein BDA99DRAFT_541987 [Phascolomyces articulosus]|uniref:Uncharacterized protein n=1 Tax=Phascolomyces articulosus TaxID=60185 RepID=A0AAD5P943_9FUNG|nr:hypothetical protein BDA99DRAFT_541987 [Phascolomyces articulosus]